MTTEEQENVHRDYTNIPILKDALISSKIRHNEAKKNSTIMYISSEGRPVSETST
jgi:hypothetical protein